MTGSETLEAGREAFRQKRWSDAYALLSEADRESAPDPQHLEMLAETAFLIGRDTDCVEAWTRAHHELLSRGDAAPAARCAFWIGFVHINTGEMAPAMGWFSRGQRILDDAGLDCAERGFLMIPQGIQVVEEDPAAARSIFAQAAEIGERFGEPDLASKARVGEGRCLIRMGRVKEGLALMDEAMVAATSGEVSAMSVGDLYCTVIEGCFEVLDLRRAQEWTAALHRWCEAQPDLVPYRGQCLIHRAEIMQIHGSWPDALDEARQACERLARHPMLGAAFYQLGELRRLRGEFSEAEEAYRRGNESGREPQPGLALLRLAQGQGEAARAAVHRVLEGAADRLVRAKLLGAYVEILLAAGEVEEARVAADELSGVAEDVDAPLLRAAAVHAHGSVLLAQGDAGAACEALRRAWRARSDIDDPYEAARSRELLALACRDLGDEDTARLELEAALAAFRDLGAAPDVERMERLSGSEAATGLTPREAEVLTLVAAGKTNRTIADELVISEKTVARHVSNIFTKLGVGSRSAATAYAYKRGLV